MLVPALVVLESATDVKRLPPTVLIENLGEVSELADHAGVTRQTVATYLDLLLETEIVEPVPNTSPQRYRVADSAVVEELFALNSALNAAID